MESVSQNQSPQDEEEEEEKTEFDDSNADIPDIDKRDFHGFTRLHRAVNDNNIEEVKQLLRDGADVNVTSAFGYSALMLAASRGRERIAGLLLEEGADPNIVRANGWTALMFAIRKAKGVGFGLGLANMLLDKGADPNLTNRNGWTALHLAADEELTLVSGVVSSLVRHGVDIEKQDFEGKTAVQKYIDIATNRTLNKELRETIGYLLKSQYVTANKMLEYNDQDTSKMRRRNLQMKKDVDCRSVPEVLNLFGIGRLPSTPENHVIKRKIEAFAERVCAKLWEIDERFDSLCKLVGSSACGIKAGLPDEFDFFIILKCLSDGLIVEETDEAGFAKVALAAKAKRMFPEFVEKGSLFSSNFKSYFVTLVCRAINVIFKEDTEITESFRFVDVEWNKVCTCIHLMYHGVFYKSLDISLDISPVLEVPGKPPGMMRSRDTGSDASYHLVFKPCPGASQNYCAISMAAYESRLIDEMSESKKEGIILTKALLNDYLYCQQLESIDELKQRNSEKDLMHVFSTLKFNPSSLIDSYIVKTAAIHEVSSYQDDFQWKGKEIVNRVLGILTYIAHCCHKKNMPHYLLQSVNVLKEHANKKIEGVPVLDLMDICAEGICAHVRSNSVPTNLGVVNFDDIEKKVLAEKGGKLQRYDELMSVWYTYEQKYLLSAIKSGLSSCQEQRILSLVTKLHELYLAGSKPVFDIGLLLQVMNAYESNDQIQAIASEILKFAIKYQICPSGNIDALTSGTKRTIAASLLEIVKQIETESFRFRQNATISKQT